MSSQCPQTADGGRQMASQRRQNFAGKNRLSLPQWHRLNVVQEYSLNSTPQGQSHGRTTNTPLPALVMNMERGTKSIKVSIVLI